MDYLFEITDSPAHCLNCIQAQFYLTKDYTLKMGYKNLR